MELTPFKRFIELISFDQQVNAVQKQIKAIEQELTSLSLQHEAIEKERGIAQRHYAAMKREVDAKEKEMTAFDEKAKLIQHKLDTLLSPKEYAPLKKELEHNRAEQHEFENLLVRTWQQFETANKDAVAAEAIYQEKMRNLETQMQEKELTVGQLKKQYADLVVERAPKEAGVPAEWLTKYQVMRARVDNPVVPVEGESCSACRYYIIASDMQALRRRALIQCKQCYRLLYLPSAMEEHEQKASN